MNFLVIGGCGYIGTQLTKHLLLKKNKAPKIPSNDSFCIKLPAIASSANTLVMPAGIIL